MKPHRGGKGFTLIEVMVSLVIVAGLLMTVMHTIHYHLGITRKQFTLTQMVSLAREKLEDMRINPRETSGSFPEPHDSVKFETMFRSSRFPGFSEITVVVRDGTETVELSELIKRPFPRHPAQGGARP